jgi:probable HAF family extracellular repeat protein
MPRSYFTHAFVTTATGPIQDLGTLGGNGASASGINNLGQIVGNSNLSGDLILHGFVYASGVMKDLNSLIVSPGWEIINASHINDNGQIVACACLTATDPPFACSRNVRLDPGPAVSALLNLLSSPALGLANGQAASLTDKLNNALLSIQQGLNKQAINQLSAFISSVQSSLKNGKIIQSTATILTNAANAIIASLS